MLAAILCAVLVACTASTVENAPPVREKNAPDREPIAASLDSNFAMSNNQFGFDLFAEVRQQNPDSNIFISPTSINLALLMAYNGAEGDTKAAIAQTLHLSSEDLDNINQNSAALMETLENLDENVQLTIANSLWTRQGIELKPDFLDRVSQFYNARAESLDFDDPSAVETINNWVADRTNDKIDGIIDRISPDNILFLINAIYFKGNWTVPFPEARTSDRPFTLADGSQKQHPLMSVTDDFDYLETETFQAVFLPYGEGKLGFYIFLPQENTSLAEFYADLNAENWQNWTQQLTRQRGTVALPKFKLEYGLSLNPILQNLGMAIAFDANAADFSGLQEPPPSLAIDEVKHKSFIEVNEAGTEAAASTSVGVTATSVPVEEFEMTVDRPFGAAIADTETGTILFFGSIVDPVL